jgi:hypothetical protein
MFRKILPFACLLLVLVLIDCKKDPEPVPQEPTLSLSLIDSVANIQVLKTISLSLNATVPQGTQSALCQVWLNGAVLDTLFSAADSIYDISETVTFYIKPAYEGANITFTFAMEDLRMNVLGDTLELIIPESKISIIKDKLLGTYENVDLAGFYDVVGDTSYFGPSLGSTKLKRSIDFVYYFTKVGGGVLTSPSNDLAETTWTEQIGGLWPLFGVENATSIYELPANTNLDEISTAVELENLLKGKTAIAEIKPVKVGQVIGFQLVESKSSKVGVIKITEVAGNTVSTSTIKFDGKVAR